MKKHKNKKNERVAKEEEKLAETEEKEDPTPDT
jgi:hypothetical protein